MDWLDEVRAKFKRKNQVLFSKDEISANSTLKESDGASMFWNAKNGQIPMGDTEKDYISFGRGTKTLIMIPGVGDGLTTVKGLAVPTAFLYRKLSKDYRVYVFSRKNHLEEAYSTKDMAVDQAKAMRVLGISKAMVIGVSQGGMIAQHLAIEYPDLVEKLVLVVTLARQNPAVQQALGKWTVLAEQGKHKALMIDTAEKSYSEKHLKTYRLMYPLLGVVGKPKSYERFLIQLQSCLQHDTYDALEKIRCPTLVIGGDCDKIVGAGASTELADRIPNSELFVYEGLGHGLYEEAKDFISRVQSFLSK